MSPLYFLGADEISVYVRYAFQRFLVFILELRVKSYSKISLFERRSNLTKCFFVSLSECDYLMVNIPR